MELVEALNRDNRNRLLAKAILSKRVFKTVFGYINKQEYKEPMLAPLTEIIIGAITADGYNRTTATRRASTVHAWLKWLNINVPQ